jgi:pyrroloquinoline quinone (PQQ) biosynthesis protein C
VSKINVEWVSVSEDLAIVSRETGEFWFLDLYEDLIPFTRPMTRNGARGSTAGLLNGAVALGFASEGDDVKRGTISLPKYVLDLIGSYHISRRTPNHFSRAAERFRELRRPDIATYLETHGREETGHDRLVLKDLRALGLPAERIVANFVPEGMQPLCELFDRLCAAEYPVGCIGYCYCFESTAALKQKSEVEALEALCPEGIDASRFLRTHSGLGSELAHVEELIDFIASLPASDRIEIVKAAYETALAMANRLRRDGRMSDAAILAKIQAAAGQEINLAA